MFVAESPVLNLNGQHELLFSRPARNIALLKECVASNRPRSINIAVLQSEELKHQTLTNGNVR